MPAKKNTKLTEILKSLDLIDNEKLDQALKESQKQDISLEEYLINEGLVSEQELGRVIADNLEVPYIDLKKTDIDKNSVKQIPRKFSAEQNLVVFKIDNNEVHVTTSNPENKRALDFIQKKLEKPIKVYYSTPPEIRDALHYYKKGLQKQIEELLKNAGKEPPVKEIVNVIIETAHQDNASDIHFEPQEEYSLVRYRIDGVLHDATQFPKELHQPLITRIKVMAKLRTDRHSSAQDGRVTYKIDGNDLDIRVSLVPVTEGEKAVLRLLYEQSQFYALSELGIDEKNLEKVKKAAEASQGMVLATGPTGSGKTTTLYAILNLLNNRGVNIMTVEDPVEFDIENINQIQVNEDTNLTFAEGLRSIVRQDPDIILVGEMRDEETADIAINSAMTGHLVLSTIHANDAATTFPRLLEMQIEPFLAASSVNMIIAQRLVRKICEKCRMSYEVPKEELNDAFKQFFEDESVRLYKGKGCSVCHNSGYDGRIGVFEILLVNDQIRDAVVNKQSASEIKNIAQENGMKTILQDGIQKAKEGVTSIEEVIRVTAKV